MLNEMIAVYAITDDVLKAVGHREDCCYTISIYVNQLKSCLVRLLNAFLNLSMP